MKAVAEAKIRGAFRTIVFENAGGVCEYCQTPEKYSVQPFVVDQIIPVYKGGSDRAENLAWACGGCNAYKHTHIEGFDALEGVLIRLFHSRNDKWAEHFSWNQDFSMIVGTSAIGRATVEILQLNRAGLINIRKLLVMIGQFPNAR